MNFQLGTHANKQGRIAGVNATGGDSRFPGVIGTAVAKVCKYEVARTGLSETEATARFHTSKGAWPPSRGSSNTSWNTSTPPAATCGDQAS